MRATGSPANRLESAYGGLQDFGALYDRTQQSYNTERQALNDPSQIGDPFRSLKIADTIANAQQPMAPWLQAQQEAPAVSGKYRGSKAPISDLANDPAWWAHSDGPFAPTLDSIPASLRPFTKPGA